MSCPSQYEIDSNGNQWLALSDGARYRIAWDGRGSLTPGYRGVSATALVIQHSDRPRRSAVDRLEFGWHSRPLPADAYTVELEHPLDL